MPTVSHSLEVALGSRRYSIHIGTGNLSAGVSAATLVGISRVVVVTNEVVAPLYAPPLSSALAAIAPSVPHSLCVLPDGEAIKDWATLDQIFSHLLEHNADRKTLLVALGGGVIGDMVGFAAATYQRGIAFVQVPTTLLAQVDSSVGGKTAINHALGKNMVGAFHQPREVIIDTDVLATLPPREFVAGVAEVLKYGIALDAGFFAWLEANLSALMTRDPSLLAEAIHRSCAIKARVVADDEFETKASGGRALLNYGHTFGHAIEAALGYGVWLHGEAVGCGMALATRLSVTLGQLDAAVGLRIEALLKRAGLATVLPDITPDTMLTHMARDKKNEHGVIRLILLPALGAANVDSKVPRDTLRQFLVAEHQSAKA